MLHAYDYYPDDPVLCLSLGLASLGRAMQRQADNRNYLVIQVCLALSVYVNFDDNYVLVYGFHGKV